MVNYIVFTVGISICLIFAKLSKPLKAFSSHAVLMLALLFSALRYDVGWDYEGYFLAIQSGNIPDYWELLPKVLGYISHCIGFPYLFFIITSMWIIGFTYAGFKKYVSDSFLPFMLYLFYPFLYLNSFSIIRQFMAMSLVLFASNYLFIQKRVFPFTVASIVAYMCHRTAFFASLIFLFVYISKRWLGKYRRVLAFAMGVLIFFIFIGRSIISRIVIYLLTSTELRYANYVTVHQTIGGQKAIYMNLLFVTFLILVVFLNVCKSKKMALYTSMVSIGALMEVAFSPFGHIGLRMALYFYQFFPLAFYMPYKKEKGLSKILYICVVILIFLFVFYYAIYIDWSSANMGKSAKSQFVPYKTIIEVVF